MSLFQCEECGAKENTATGAYWGRDKKLCSECSTGKWHGKFKKIILPKGEFKTSGEGNLEHISTGSTCLEKFVISE